MQDLYEFEMFRFFLAKYLETHNYTHADFADRSGLSLSIHNYLTGKTPPPVRVLAKCCIAMNVTADWLLGITTQKGSCFPHDVRRLIDAYNLATYEDKGKIDSILIKYKRRTK